MSQRSGLQLRKPLFTPAGTAALVHVYCLAQRSLVVRGGRGRVPLYYEGKVLFVLWLWHPKTRGAAYLYQHTVQAAPLPRRPPGCLVPAGVAHLLRSAPAAPHGVPL